MPTKHCAIGICTSDSRYPQTGVFFVPFVKPNIDKQRCLRWIDACKRTNFGFENIKKHTYICSKHFVGGNGPTSENPDPVPATESKISNARPTKKFKGSAVFHQTTKHPPLQSHCTEANVSGDEVIGNIERDPLFLSVEIKREDSETDTADEWDTIDESSNWDSRYVIKEENICCGETLYIKETEEAQSTQDAASQTCDKVESEIVKELKREIDDLREKLDGVTLSVESCGEDEKKFRFYTGLSRQQFHLLWDCLGPPTPLLFQTWRGKFKKRTINFKPTNYPLSLENQMFLTLVRLRSGFLIDDLSYRFALSITHVRQITTAWIQFLYEKFKTLDIFPTAVATREKGLSGGFEKFKNLRVVIDTFEIGIQRSTVSRRRENNSFFNHKSRESVKFLIGVLPNGGCCFLSKGYKGSTSERELVKKSGFLESLESQDLVLADRAFKIADLCNQIGCSILVSSFFKQRPRFNKRTEARRIKDTSAARIHVARFVEKMREFRILRRTIPRNILPLISQIVFTIAMLVNFEPPLVE